MYGYTIYTIEILVQLIGTLQRKYYPSIFDSEKEKDDDKVI